jgi:tetratricopeptide (TPR) repeat protein
MSSALKSLAGAAVTALIKSDPSALAIAGGKEAIGWLIDRWRGETSQLDQLIAKVEAGLKTEFKGGADLDPAVANATALFENHGLSAGELVDLNLDPKPATEELLRRGAGMLGPDPAKQKGAIGLCCTRIVPRVHQLLLNDPTAIASLQPAIFQALLKHREAIGRLDDKLRRALELMTGWWLVSDPRRHWPRGRADAAILRAEYRVVDFHPERQAALEALQGWCAAANPIAVQLITGPGGTGKTRLAIQLLTALGPGWRTGFLHRRAEDVATVALDGVFADQKRPLLLVVDYAETRRPVVEAVLDHLRAHGAPCKVRLLLLARAAADWWRALLTASGDIRDLFAEHPPSEVQLARIADSPEQRAHVFAAALVDYAEALGRPAEAPGGIDFAAPHFANTLFLHIAALAALEGAVPQGEQALLDWALDRERGLWLERQGRDEARASALAQAATLLTLAGGAADGEEALAIFGRWPPLRAKGDDVLLAMFDLLGQLYPQDDGATGVRPDLLGEHLVEQELTRASGLLGAALAGPPEAPLTVLTRLARRRGEAQRWLEQAFASDLERLAEPAIAVAIETGDPIGQVLAAALEQQSLQDPSRLEPLIPYPTTALREVAVVVMEQMRQRLQRGLQSWPEEVQVEAARVTNNLGNRLGHLGRREEALAAAEEAVRLRRVLAAARPDAFIPALARALNNLANRLSGLGRREEALAAAEEARDLYRDLAAARGDAFTPDLATSLNNLSVFLSALGRREEALAVAEEAVRLRRTLAAARPDAFSPNLAMALNNLANRLGELGRREDALAAAEEARDLYRDLAAARPDAFTPDLASSLNNLANRLSELGRQEGAMAAAEEAVRLRRTLAAARPDACTPDLATSLNNLSVFLSELGRREAALAAAEEAVRLRRTLAAARPDAFTPDLAVSLAVLANCLEATGRDDDALAANQEAIDTLRPPFLAVPPAFAHWMLPMCQQYFERCERLGREPDGELLAPIVEALAKLEGEAGPSGQARG